MTTKTKTEAETKLDFSTKEKRFEFMRRKVEASSNSWSEPLPNLKWLTEREFVDSSFFHYHAEWQMYKTLGGPNRGADTNFPPEWKGHKAHTVYPRVFVYHDMSGSVLVGERGTGRVHYGRFAFCAHDLTRGENLGRCYNRYTCEKCGYSWEVDSSD